MCSHRCRRCSFSVCILCWQLALCRSACCCCFFIASRIPPGRVGGLFAWGLKGCLPRGLGVQGYSKCVRNGSQEHGFGKSLVGHRLGPFPGLVGVQIGPQLEQKRQNSVPKWSPMVPRKVRRHCEKRGLPIQVPFFNLKSCIPTGAIATLAKKDVFLQGT